jgi:teichoic acid transport system permease protein
MLEKLSYVYFAHKNNFRRVFSIGFAHARKQTKRTSLGFVWLFIKDIIYFTSFVLFRTLISGGREVDGMFFVIYIVTGSVPWGFMGEVINGGSQAIKKSSAIIKNIRFPVVILPTIEVVSIFIRKLFTLTIPIVVILIFGDITLINPLLFLYYFVSMFIFMTAFNFISTAFIAISEDFAMLYSAVARVLFLFLPIIWSFERLKNYPMLANIIKLNPMVYIVKGFRDAFVHGNSPTLLYSMYFWAICILCFLFGSFVQFKMRKYYADFM